MLTEINLIWPSELPSAFTSDGTRGGGIVIGSALEAHGGRYMTPGGDASLPRRSYYILYTDLIQLSFYL